MLELIFWVDGLYPSLNTPIYPKYTYTSALPLDSTLLGPRTPLRSDPGLRIVRTQDSALFIVEGLATVSLGFFS